MRKKTKTAIFLALFLLVATVLFCACNGEKTEDGGKGQQTPAEENGQVGETRKWLDDAPERDFGGYAFRMYLPEGWRDMYVEEEVGEPVDDAVWMRNKIVEDRLNINIGPVYYTEWGTPGESSILAGDDSFDIILSHGIVAYMYVNKNLVSDWIPNMPHVDLSKPWWNRDMVEENSYFGRLYAATGDIAYSTLQMTMCMFFNKELFASLAIPYPYEDVKNGTWTLDKLIGICKQGTQDLNGDGAMTFGEDRYGFAMRNQFAFPTSGLYIGGDKVVKKDENGYPVLSIYSPRTVSIFEKIFDMLETQIAFCSISDVPQVQPIFMSGLSLFFDCWIGGAVGLRQMDADIGIIPLPKYDEKTPRYYSLMEAGAQTITVPTTNKDFERTGIILEAMASEGQRRVIPQYYELTLKTKHARDDESFDMLDIIKDSMVVDWGYLNSDVTGQLGLAANYMFSSKNKNFTSFYEKHEASAKANIQKFIDKNE